MIIYIQKKSDPRFSDRLRKICDDGKWDLMPLLTPLGEREFNLIKEMMVKEKNRPVLLIDFEVENLENLIIKIRHIHSDTRSVFIFHDSRLSQDIFKKALRSFNKYGLIVPAHSRNLGRIIHDTFQTQTQRDRYRTTIERVRLDIPRVAPPDSLRYKKAIFSQSLLTAIVESSNDAIFSIDPEGVINFWNKSAVKIFGYQEDKTIGKNIKFLFTQDVWSQVGPCQDPIKQRQSQYIEFELLDNNGTKKDIALWLSPIFDLQKNDLGVSFLARDITQHKILQQKELEVFAAKKTVAVEKKRRKEIDIAYKELKKNQDELEKAKNYVNNIIRSMLDALIVVDPDGKIMTINSAITELLGYEENEIIGKPVKAILAEEDEVLFKGARLEKLIKEGSVKCYDVTYKAKSGVKIPVSFTGSVMRDKEGKLAGIVGIARDMREIKQLMRKEKDLATVEAVAAAEKKKSIELEKINERLRKTQGMLVQAGKLAAIGQLGAGIAHELNQPLQAIFGYTQVMMDELGKKNSHFADLKMIEEQAERMSKIINNIRAFSRDSKFTLKSIDIEKPIEDAFKLFSAQLKIHNIEVLKNYEENLPPIKADRNQLQQVFINLISNAEDEMNKHNGGRIWVGTRMLKPDKGKTGLNIEISFKNEGPPIAKNVLGHVFDPFFTTKEPGKGTGLGLSISYGIIKDHKGQIMAVNKEDGVEFVITLPV